MNICQSIQIVTEKPEDYEQVELLAEKAFGPGRFARTAFRLREGVPHEPDLSFVCWLHKEAIAAVKLTKIWIGEKTALLLGPLVVSDAYKCNGYGAILMETAVEAARAAGHDCIILVGDLPYYQKFGFEVVPAGKITLPGPVDPQRLLVCELKPGSFDEYGGVAPTGTRSAGCKPDLRNVPEPPEGNHCAAGRSQGRCHRDQQGARSEQSFVPAVSHGSGCGSVHWPVRRRCDRGLAGDDGSNVLDPRGTGTLYRSAAAWPYSECAGDCTGQYPEIRHIEADFALCGSNSELANLGPAFGGGR